MKKNQEHTKKADIKEHNTLKPEDPYSNIYKNPPGKIRKQEFSKIFSENILKSSSIFLRSLEIFFAYGLENRKIRRDGIRRFRYRESMQLLKNSLPCFFRLESCCSNDYEHYISRLLSRFAGNFHAYAILGEHEIPADPLVKPHFGLMEDYLILAIKDYLVPHIVHSFKKTDWKTSFSQSWNLLVYLETGFPQLTDSRILGIYRNLADSYNAIRKEESEENIHFFPG